MKKHTRKQLIKHMNEDSHKSLIVDHKNCKPIEFKVQECIYTINQRSQIAREDKYLA